MTSLEYEIEKLKEQKNSVYAERNQLVSLVARMAQSLGLNSWRALHPISDVSWETDWRNIVFIELPTGQASWHFHDSEAHLLEGLPWGENNWDGHMMTEKYTRVNEAFQTKTHSFSWALIQLKAGKRVARQGWNGKGMWIALTLGSNIPRSSARPGAAAHLAADFEEGVPNLESSDMETMRIGAHIDMRAADGSLVIGWLASQTDMLAEDWVVL